MSKRTVSPWLSGFMVLLVGGLVLIGIYATKPDPPRPLVPDPDPAPVHTRRLALEERSRVVRCFGETQGLRTAQLAVEVAGRVLWRSPVLEAGARIEAGEALLRLEDAPYRLARDAARATLQAAQAESRLRQNELERLRANLGDLEEQAELALKEFERWQGLAQSGEARAQEAERGRTLYLAARLAAQNARFGVSGAEAALQAAAASEAQAAAALARAEYELERTTLKAPFAGEVSMPRSDVGDWLLPGAPVCALIDRSVLRVVSRIANEDTLGLDLSAPVRVRFTALEDGDGLPRVLEAALIGLEPAARPDSRSRAIVATVPNPGLQIPAGAFAELLVDRGVESALWLRPSEFALRGDAPVAFAVAEGARAAERRLILGRPLIDEDSRAWHPVLEGLQAGELLAVDNLEMLESGSPLTLLGEPAPPAAEPAGDSRPGR